MYNSRPRNYRGGFAVPENYSGNAFGDEEKGENEPRKEIETDSEIVEEEKAESLESFGEAESAHEKEEKAETVEVGAAPRGTARFGFNASRLFRGGIGFEEILIIALILLISQSDNNEDVIVLLALLLFIS